MKNYEKYADKIRECSSDSNFCNDFVIPHIFKPGERCYNLNCGACRMRQMIWLMEEYEEPGIDWSRVKIDTPILVRDSENSCWHKVHFAKYKDGEIYAGANGGTSWSSRWTCRWKYAKLAPSEESDEYIDR